MTIPATIGAALPGDPLREPMIVYDGECPFCSAYVTHYRLRQALGGLKLINAREHPSLAAAFAHEGIDLNEGMVFVYEGHLHHGSKALHTMALLSSPSGMFNRTNAWIFRHPRVAAALYPVMRGGRNLVLRLLGRSKI